MSIRNPNLLGFLVILKEPIKLKVQNSIIVGFSEIGSAIKEQRIQLGITQPDLAEIAGISVNTLCNIERGQGNPTLKTLIQLSDVLGLQLQLRVKDPVEVVS